MKRTPLTRKTPLKRSGPIKTKKKAKGVPKDLYTEVITRDRGCVARTLMPEITCWGRLDPHHILRRSQGGPDEATNLITLCRAHHSAVHEQVARSITLGLLRKPTAQQEQT